MKIFTRSALLAAVAGMAVAVSPVAAATTITIDPVLEQGSFSATHYGTADAPVSFTDEFDFYTDLDGQSAAQIGEVSINLNYLDVTSVKLNGVEIMPNLTGMGNSWFAQVSAPTMLSPTANVLLVSGTTVNNGGTYTGTVSLSPLPEPASWAMMVGGFGLLGAALRRKRDVSAVSFG